MRRLGGCTDNCKVDIGESEPNSKSPWRQLPGTVIGTCIRLPRARARMQSQCRSLVTLMN